MVCFGYRMLFHKIFIDASGLILVKLYFNTYFGNKINFCMNEMLLPINVLFALHFNSLANSYSIKGAL